MVGDKNGVDNGDFDVGWIWRWLQVPASVNDFFVIRFAVCAEKANEKDIGEFGFNFASFCAIFSVREPDQVKSMVVKTAPQMHDQFCHLFAFQRRYIDLSVTMSLFIIKHSPNFFISSFL